MSTTLPTAQVLKVRRVRDTVLVDVRCPVCGHRHQHGFASGVPGAIRDCPRRKGGARSSYLVVVAGEA